MLPLISNVLPTTPAVSSPSASASATYLFSGMADASAATRQQLPSAVMAAAAPAAYFPGTLPQRENAPARANDRVLRVPVPPPTGDYIEVQQPPPTSTAGIRYSMPVTLGIPLTTQLSAQFLAQQAAAGGEQTLAMRDERLVKSKEPTLSTAKGAIAYGMAAARTAALGPVLPREAEAGVTEAVS